MKPTRTKKPEKTKEAHRLLANVVRDLGTVVEGQNDIRWHLAETQALWQRVVKVTRDLDRAISVSAYSHYATDPATVRFLLDHEEFDGSIWEPCSGSGWLARALEDQGYRVHASDFRDHDIYGERGVDVFDFEWMDNAITNPPFPMALPITEHLVKVAARKVAVLIPWDLYGPPMARRRYFLDHPPARVYRLTTRPTFFVSGDPKKRQGGRKDYAWCVWDRDHDGDTKVYPRPSPG